MNSVQLHQMGSLSILDQRRLSQVEKLKLTLVKTDKLCHAAESMTTQIKVVSDTQM